MKNIGNLFVRRFAISLLTFRYFSTIVSLFGAGAAPFFTAPAPAPAPRKPFRRLRLRLRPKCVGSGGSGSASLLKTPVSYAVLSQDSNVVNCFGVRCSEPPKIAIEIFDVITLHTQWNHLVVKKWTEWLEICHVDWSHAGFQHIFRFSWFFKVGFLDIFCKKKCFFMLGIKTQNCEKLRWPSPISLRIRFFILTFFARNLLQFWAIYNGSKFRPFF